jgi:hypothetical protein
LKRWAAEGDDLLPGSIRKKARLPGEAAAEVHRKTDPAPVPSDPRSMT